MWLESFLVYDKALHRLYIVADDDMATQGAATSAAMILTQKNRDNSVPAR